MRHFAFFPQFRLMLHDSAPVTATCCGIYTLYQRKGAHPVYPKSRICIKKAPISMVLETELDCLYYIHAFTIEIKNKTVIIE